MSCMQKSNPTYCQINMAIILIQLMPELLNTIKLVAASASLSYVLLFGARVYMGVCLFFAWGPAAVFFTKD